MIKRDYPEILAPAGSFEAVVAAVNSGADAVYLGQKNFSARASAANFDEEELCRAVELCHRFGVRVHQAVNTVVFDSEIPALEACIRTACKAGVDAFIVQDLGVAAYLKQWAPSIPRHASTQMSVTSLAGVLQAAELGFSRAVLAREMTLKEIEAVAKASPIELEVFVHGALCMSVSGQCTLSAMIGSRSANRGGCAQPCRLPFSADATGSADLSLKDLCALEQLATLAEMGITSFKIEGRMKRPEYVGAAVRAVYQKLRGTEPDLETLRSVFSRGGFTNGYLEGKRDIAMFGVRSKEDVVASQGVLERLAEENRLIVPRDTLSMTLQLRPGDPAKLTVSDTHGNTVSASGEPVAEAKNKPTDAERAKAALEKLGGTPYRLGSVSVETDGAPFVPVSALNALRREAVEALDRERFGGVKQTFRPGNHPVDGRYPKGGCRLRVRYASAEQWTERVVSEAELVYLPIAEVLNDPERFLPYREKLVLELPRVRYEDTALEKQLAEAKVLGFSKAAAQNLGHFRLAKEAGLEVYGFYGLNLTNSVALDEVKALGAVDAALSFEIKLAQAARLNSPLPVGLFVYGSLPLMIFRNCPLRARKGCAGCDGRTLTDRLGNRFPVRCDGEMAELFNCYPLVLSDRMSELRFADFGVLYFTAESAEDCERIWEQYRRGGAPTGEFTRGLYYRGVE